MSAVRTRFAPSPTGFLHLGVGAHRPVQLGLRPPPRRQADPAHRGHRPRALDRGSPRTPILDGLSWLGIDWDEGPFRQSERAERHGEVDRVPAREGPRLPLPLHPGGARRAQAADDRRAAASGPTTGAVATSISAPTAAPTRSDCASPTTRISRWDDLVFGPSGQDASEIGDMIIRRSDGSALFNLAVVVDDSTWASPTSFAAPTTTPTRPSRSPSTGPRRRAPDLRPRPADRRRGRARSSASGATRCRSSTSASEGFLPAGDLQLARPPRLVPRRPGDLLPRGDRRALRPRRRRTARAPRPTREAPCGSTSTTSKELPPRRAAPRSAALSRARGRTGRSTVTPGLERLLDLLRERSKTLVEMARAGALPGLRRDPLRREGGEEAPEARDPPGARGPPRRARRASTSGRSRRIEAVFERVRGSPRRSRHGQDRAAGARRRHRGRGLARNLRDPRRAGQGAQRSQRIAAAIAFVGAD